MTADVNHFAAMAGFALLASIALGCVAPRSNAGRLRHAAVSFLMFMVIGIVIAWILFPFSR